VEFTNTVAASYGLLAMHAMDMYRGAAGLLHPPPAPGLTAAGWEITAYIIGRDTLLDAAKVKLGDKTVFYGYLAKQPAGTMAAVIRGTDGFVEWVEDAEFVPIPYAPDSPLPAGAPSLSVEQGFWTIYQTMQLIDPDGVVLGAIVPALVAAAGADAPVCVVGHSLGAALATYLAADLVRGGLGGRVSACLFASPRPGNSAFATFFNQTVQTYRLFNYILDLVPRVPLGLGYAPLPQRTVLQPATAEASIRVTIACNHHVVCYCAMLDYEATQRALNPMPPDEANSAACILGPETGQPSLAKQLVADLAGVVPV
jgi:hypothetical protein